MSRTLAVMTILWSAAVACAASTPRANSLDVHKANAPAGELAFIHIPKTAGTTVEAAGSNHGILWGGMMDASVWRYDTFKPGGWGNPEASQWSWTVPQDVAAYDASWPARRMCSAWHVPPAAFQRDLAFNPYEGKETFCIVRDPFARAVSEVNYEGEYIKSYWKRVFATKRAAANVTAQADAPEGFCDPFSINAMINHRLDTAMPFLLDFVEWDGHLAVNDSAIVSDCHWLPQTAYTHGPGVPPCDHVLHLESLHDDWQALMADRDGAIDAADLPTSAQASHCALNATVLDDGTRERIAALYLRDFELLGYGTSA